MSSLQRILNLLKNDEVVEITTGHLDIYQYDDKSMKLFADEIRLAMLDGYLPSIAHLIVEGNKDCPLLDEREQEQQQEAAREGWNGNEY